VPRIEAIIQSGIDEHLGTVPILEDIIEWLVEDRGQTLQQIKDIRAGLQEVKDTMEKKR
jgi:hypothetical protein